MEIREKYRILRFQKKIRFKELAGLWVVVYLKSVILKTITVG